MPKIGLDTLKKIIREEIQVLSEGADHDTASKNVANATKLLNSIESFKGNVSEKVKVELSQQLDDIVKVLNRIVSSPMQYVDVVKPPVKKVTLKSTKSNLV